MSGTKAQRFTGEGKTDVATYHVQGKRIGSVIAPVQFIDQARETANFYGPQFVIVYSQIDSAYIVLRENDAVLFCHYGNGRIIR